MMLNMLAQCGAIPMRKPHGMIAIMFGHPSRLAHDDDEPGRRDEDNLGHEQGFDHGPTNTLDLLYERMRHGDVVAQQAAMLIGRCFQEMANRAARGDKNGLRHAYEKCCDLISDVDGEEERNEQ
jgi:hypothetical protein